MCLTVKHNSRRTGNNKAERHMHEVVRRCYMETGKKPITVRCIYNEKGESAESLLIEAFRTFIQINLWKTAQNLT